MNQTGSVLLALIIMMPFFILIVASFMDLAVNNYSISKKDQYRTHAQLAADAGIDASMESINTIVDWPGSGSQKEVHAGDASVRTTYETVVNPVDDDTKKLSSTGRSFTPASNTTNPSSEITIEITLRAVGSGSFSIVTGVGGLYLSNSAKVLGGDVFVNGEINMQGNSQIGLTTNPVKLSVANQNCPLPSNPNFNAEYPRVCTAADGSPEPISISNPAWIYGDVTANNQTTNTRMSNNGLIGSSGITPKVLPEHDRGLQKSSILPANDRSGADASCTTNGGSKTWEANTKIIGNVEIDKDCTVTIKGDVWITGNFNMSHSKAKLKIDDALDTTQPVVMVDGQVTKFSNGSTIIGNIKKTGAYIISYWTTASCYPDCSNVTGSELYNSRDQVAITMSQSSSGPETIFYSRWGKVLIENSGDIGALVGQTVELQNSGVITFGSSVGVGAVKFWLIDGYRRDI